MESLGFGRLLSLMMDRRSLAVSGLAVRAGVSTGDVGSLLAGRTPGAALLRRLAPALDLHAVDLFILAGLPVPEGLAPLDGTAGTWVARAVTDMAQLPAPERQDLLRQLRSLPQEERRSPFVPQSLMPLATGPGAWPVRMLQYRNLNWMGMARTLAFLTPTYLSAATYGAIASGREELTPRLVLDFAAVLSIDAGELAGLTGVPLPEAPPLPSPKAVDIATLLWEARRLSGAQAQAFSELARSLLGARPRARACRDRSAENELPAPCDVDHDRPHGPVTAAT